MENRNVSSYQPESRKKELRIEHLFGLFVIGYGLWVLMPFMAPVFMHLGWTSLGKALYFFYSFFCHQLPQRSLFLFGSKVTYSLGEIQAAWQLTNDPVVLRQFIGNESMGWKVAWSDRMISLYTSIWFFALLAFPFRRRIRFLPWWGYLLFFLPLILDGFSHLISDLAGIGNGFRDTNVWLATLTGYSMPATFYAGDALGSFNSLMRWFSGILAGAGLVWLLFPLVFVNPED